MANDDQPLDLSLPEMERKARKRYLELLASRPDYLVGGNSEIALEETKHL